MPGPYGVIPTGFNRKPLETILEEGREAARTIFGPDVVVDHESPMGQLIGMFSLLASQKWELAEDTYQSYDPDQAEGVRLDTLARLRVVERGDGESDVDLRLGITNQGRSRTDITDLHRALLNVDGVTSVQIFVNDADEVDDHGIPGHSVAVAVVGGDSDVVATVMRAYIVPGIGTHGNERVDTTIDGLCRSIWMVRPVPVRTHLSITVRTYTDKMGCPPPSTSVISAGVHAELTGGRSLINGADVTEFAIRQAVECRWPNVEFVSATGARSDLDSPVLGPLPLEIGFNEIASFDPNDIEVILA